MSQTLAADTVMETWLGLMWGDDEPDLDDLAEMPRVRPEGSVLRAWIVAHAHDATLPTQVAKPGEPIKRVDVPPPTFQQHMETCTVSIWFMQLPVRLDKEGEVNLYRLVASMLAAGLKGTTWPEYANPLVDPGAFGQTGGTVHAKEMSTALQKAGLGKHRLDWQARQHGGQKRTPEQTAARSANFAKAREVARQQKAEKADEKARQIVTAAATSTPTEIAEQFGLAPASVRKTVSRARERVGDQEPQSKGPSGPLQTTAAPTEGPDLTLVLSDLGPERPRPRTLWEARQRRREARTA